MKISTVIPVYNTNPKFFRECVNSVLNQTRPVDEIIIVDDGSDSPETLDELYHSRLHLHPLIKIITQKNKRIPGALNAGIKMMSGDWWAGCASDDRWLPNKIEEQIRFIDSHSEAKVIYSDWNYIDMLGSIVGTYTEPGFKDRFEAGRYLIKAYFGNWSGLMTHKSIFDDIGLYNENLIIHEDYEFNARILAKYMMHRIPKVLFQYRTNTESISFNKMHGSGTDEAKRCIEIGRAIAIEHFGNEEDRKKYPLWKFDE